MWHSLYRLPQRGAKTIKEIQFPEPLQRKMQVAAYARVSSGKDAMLQSLSAQVSYYSDLIQEETAWDYVGVYADEAITGTKEERPEFQRMLSDCYDGKIDMIITKSISRFARSTVTLLETIRKLKSQNVDVYFQEQNIHTLQAEGELMLTILASYAQEESRSASENQKWRIRRNFENGTPWNAVIYGYRLEDGQFQIIPEEATIVQRIFEEYLEGAGYLAIAKGLRDDSVPTRLGRQWHHSTIRKMLHNSTYIGELILQKTYRDNHINKRAKPNQGELPQYHVQTAHEPIITQTMFQQVQDEIERRAKKVPPKRTPGTYPYSGLLVCANCGKHYRRKPTATQNVWICATYNTLGKAHCPSKQIPESILEGVTATVTADISTIHHIEVENGNQLHYHLQDGSVVTKTWADRSRSESWTEEKRSQARQRRTSPWQEPSP